MNQASVRARLAKRTEGISDSERAASKVRAMNMATRAKSKPSMDAGMREPSVNPVNPEHIHNPCKKSCMVRMRVCVHPGRDKDSA